MAYFDLVLLFLASTLNALAHAAAGIAVLLGYVAEVVAYFLYQLWVAIVRGATAIIEWADEQFPEFGIQDEPLLRALVMGIVGTVLGIILVMLLAIAMGNWAIPVAFAVSVGFCAGVGLVADPDTQWKTIDFPSFLGRGGPRMPLNL